MANQKYRLADGVRARRFGDELVLLDLVRELSYSVNAPAALLIAALDDDDFLDTAARKACAEYDVEFETVRDDLKRLIDLLFREHVLVRR